MMPRLAVGRRRRTGDGGTQGEGTRAVGIARCPGGVPGVRLLMASRWDRCASCTAHRGGEPSPPRRPGDPVETEGSLEFVAPKRGGRGQVWECERRASGRPSRGRIRVTTGEGQRDDDEGRRLSAQRRVATTSASAALSRAGPTRARQKLAAEGHAGERRRVAPMPQSRAANDSRP